MGRAMLGTSGKGGGTAGWLIGRERKDIGKVQKGWNMLQLDLGN